jgi:hypothetical protein
LVAVPTIFSFLRNLLSGAGQKVGDLIPALPAINPGGSSFQKKKILVVLNDRILQRVVLVLVYYKRMISNLEGNLTK